MKDNLIKYYPSFSRTKLILTLLAFVSLISLANSNPFEGKKVEDEVITAEETKLEISEVSIAKAAGIEEIKEGYPIEGKTAKGNLRLRSWPWGAVVEKYPEGTSVKILGESGEFYLVEVDGQQGYMHRSYISTDKEKASLKTPSYPGDTKNGGYIQLAKGVEASKKGKENIDKGDACGWDSVTPCEKMPSRVSSEYGWRIHPVTGQRKFHNGVDLPVPTGTRLNAMGNGVVTAVGFESGGGNYVRIKYDNGYETFYCHLQKSTVKMGERVECGQQVAVSDNTGKYTTGAHLHMEVKVNGERVNPRDYVSSIKKLK